MKAKKRLFEVKLEGDDKSTASIFEKMSRDLIAASETKLEEKSVGIKTKLEAEFSEKSSELVTKLEADFEEKLNSHKQEIIELTKVANQSSIKPSKVEEIQLQRLNACLKDGEKKVELEDLHKYNDKLNSQIKSALNGDRIQLDATIAGFAGYDEAKGGALIVPELDMNIRQDFVEYDEGLLNAITWEPAMSRTKKVVVDTVEPDQNTQAVVESLEAIGYELDDGCFVSATLNLKDYDTSARLTFDQIEDTAFRIETYANGKLIQGNRRKIAKDLVCGNSAKQIKGLISYPQGSGYGKVGVTHVATAGTVTMADIIALCQANKNKGILFIDKATWGTAITEQKTDGDYLFRLGSVSQVVGAQPFHFDAVVPFLNVPVIFDDGFTQPAAVAANVRAAILPPSAFAGFKRPVGRLGVKNEMKYRDLMLTERYDAVLTQFNYVKLLLNTEEA